MQSALANPALLLYKMQQKGYKLAFLLVPMSLPWLWLMFVGRKDLTSYDHVIFLLYFMSFMFLLAVVAPLLMQAKITAAAVHGILLVACPLLHLFVHLEGTYALSTGGALWRTAFLSVAAGATLILYVALILVLGLLD